MAHPGEAPPLVAKVTHEKRRAWTTGREFISKKAGGEEERVKERGVRMQGGEGEAEGSTADREWEPHWAEG